MDKSAIKKYAVWARRELIERVSQRAMFYGVTSKSIGDPDAAEVNGRLLSPVEKKQRQALIRNVREKGFDQVMEEVAYTWFNRFAALRFMEVNGYLPSLVRVFTNEAGEFKPQILSEALHLELEGLNKQRVLELESVNKSEELFRYLLIVQCNALNSILPGLFQRIEDYTELLLPDNLLRDGSVIEQMVSSIPEEDWTDQVQIIGWLYQYYNTEPKDKVFADLKKNIKITKENIPAATQLFTPDWIVHYMVENSLGRLWLEGHPNGALKSEWKYYLDEAEQEPEVEAQLTEIRKEYAALKPEEIRVIDPCCGSGHILVVMFDVLVQIYEDYGYTAREAAVKIVENNLWGLDIDERAAQLSYFAVMMKARQYDRRFFSRDIQPHVYTIEESNGITSAPMHDMGLDLTSEEYAEAVKQAMCLVEEMHDAKEYGSIIHVTPCDWDLLRRFAVPRWVSEGGQIPMEIHGEIEAAPRLQKLINIGEALAQKYHAVVTNPPYMAGSGMGDKLSKYVKKNHPYSKSDLCNVTLEQGLKMLINNGFVSMITMESWMYLTTSENFRNSILNSSTITSMIHMPYLGKGGTSLGINFGTQMSSIRKCVVPNYIGTYDRIVYTETDEDGVPYEFPVKNNYYTGIAQDSFYMIPGIPIAYWIPHEVFHLFKQRKMESFAPAVHGFLTGHDEGVIFLWHEVVYDDISVNIRDLPDDGSNETKYVPLIRGGEYRKWYGNYYLALRVDEWAFRYLADYPEFTLKGRAHYFHEGVSWPLVTSGKFSAKHLPDGYLFGNNGPTIFRDSHAETMQMLGFMNSCVAEYFLDIINPTMSCSAGVVKKLPIIKPDLWDSSMPEENRVLCKEDWDAFEVSLDFNKHPLLYGRSPKGAKISEAFAIWEQDCLKRFEIVRKNEEKLNQQYIDLYGLNEVLSCSVDADTVSIRLADVKRDIRSFLSYAVGCMFGRYSLDVSGIAYAGGEWDSYKYNSFLPDKDGIIPICDDEYFEDDIVGRFVKFVEVVYGKETLEENLRFIADALGGKGSSREVIRNYFINDFYADHLKVYQKRPIYWLFDSGKKNGFKCLIYMHRYQPDTIARIRTDYVHEQQSRYRTAIADLEHRFVGASTIERVKLLKQLAKVRDQAEELRVYEEKIHHLADQMISIDLDDGVKVNYAKFQDVLAKIK